MKSKIIVAIDGYSSTGKSTIAKQLAKHFGYVYVDTGAMYRAVTLFMFRNRLVSEETIQEEALVLALQNVIIHFEYNSEIGYAEIFLNGVNVESQIRSLQISNLVSKVAAVPAVRTKMVKLQQAMGRHGGLVMDGRDIGTVVFPNAELKLFMTASAEVRTQRRFDEMTHKGDVVTYEEVYENIVARDFLDENRATSPLTKAKDAIVIDNSHLTREVQFKKIVALVNEKLN